MPQNYGKAFENQFRQDIRRLGMFIYRLPDQMSGYAGYSKNPCDFFVYSKPNLFLLECKTVHGNTFPLSNFTQYELMKSYVNIQGVYGAVIIWFVDHDKIIYVPIEQVKQMKEEQKKSINIKDLDNIRIVPAMKKRIFMQGDYSFLKEIGNE